MLKPWLEERRSKSFPDPSEFAKHEDPKEAFYYAALSASIFKKVIAEFLHYLEVEVPDRVRRLQEKEKGEEKDFQIGR